MSTQELSPAVFMPEAILQSQEIVGHSLDPQYMDARELVTRIYESARRLDESGYPARDIDLAICQLGVLPDVEILSAPNFAGEKWYRCAEWTFGTVQGEPWAQQGFIGTTMPEFWQQPAPFLQRRGYRFTDQPQVGSIVAYGDQHYDGRLWLEHFGIVSDWQNGRPRVTSKFGRGPLVKHPLDVVSNVWGSKCYFLRKTGT